MKKGSPMAMPDDKKWQAESDLRALRQAQEIQSNRSRLSAVRTLAAQEQKALSKVVARPSASKPSRGKK